VRPEPITTDPPLAELTAKHRKEQLYKLAKKERIKDAKFHLILTESHIHRLTNYYKTKQILPSPPPHWKQEPSTVSAL
ncbi:40S ribosomal protein S13, partial [Galemys pyrenaicus]